MAEWIMEKKEVEANPFIYNKGESSYSDRYKKEETWQKIAFVLSTDVKQCKERWKNLRDTFAKYYKKEKNVPSGSQALPKKKSWPYFEIMKFLIPNVEVPRTAGNMAAEKENSFVDVDLYEVSFDGIEEAPTCSNQRPKDSIDVQEPTSKKKKKSELDKFFLSLAQRASSWSRKKQSKLEMRTLEVFHQIEFDECL